MVFILDHLEIPLGCALGLFTYNHGTTAITLPEFMSTLSYSANCTAISIDVDNTRGALSPQMWPYSRIEWAWGAAKARKVCCNSVHGQYGVEAKRHSYIVQHPGVNPSSVRAVASTTCHGDEIEARQGAVCMCIACRW